MSFFKSFLKMLLTFAPWLSFLIIAHGSMFRLRLGIIVAAIMTVIMAVTRLHRGVIMWVGILFFAYAIVAVVLLNDMWAMHYMGALANGALAAGTWAGMALKRPFTLEYAREHTDRSLWNNPAFLRTNYFMTAIWGVVFTINAFLAWQRSTQPAMPGWVYETISYSLLVSAMFFSTWYPQNLKRRRAAQAE
ncbi:MAG: hypothetical protein C0392_15045 [Syntrophus sp. (in: bacteria)]|nr:hypothetical protein [Syntrophus sp. (in: bacteria)]